MEKEFVPYILAVELKELGFDEPCLSCYDEEKTFEYDAIPNNQNLLQGFVSAPTFSQAFRFFREKYGLFAEITLWGDGLGYISMIKEIKQEEFIEVYKKDIVDTGLPIWEYEESETACLKKLIEIVKEKK